LGETLEQRAWSVQLAGCGRSAGDLGSVFGNRATCANKLSLGSLRGFIAAMKLPNGEWAYIDMITLRGYTLSPTHPEGKHKARVFAAALGISVEQTEWLRDELLKAALESDCQRGRRDEHGQRYTVDFMVSYGERTVRLRSAWNVRPDENFPRLVSCYVLED
jgi:hypothetical protein